MMHGLRICRRGARILGRSGFSSCSTEAQQLRLLGFRAQAQEPRCVLSCSRACGIFTDQGSNPCLLHWQAESYPLSHQGAQDIPSRNGNRRSHRRGEKKEGKKGRAMCLREVFWCKGRFSTLNRTLGSKWSPYPFCLAQRSNILASTDLPLQVAPPTPFQLPPGAKCTP